MASNVSNVPQDRNSVTLAEEKDQYGLPSTRVTYSWCDNDKRMNAHALRSMNRGLPTAGTREIWVQADETCHLNGMCRMWSGPGRASWMAIAARGAHSICGFATALFFPTVDGVNPLLDDPGDRQPDRQPDQSALHARRTRILARQTDSPAWMTMA